MYLKVLDTGVEMSALSAPEVRAGVLGGNVVVAHRGGAKRLATVATGVRFCAVKNRRVLFPRAAVNPPAAHLAFGARKVLLIVVQSVHRRSKPATADAALVLTVRTRGSLGSSKRERCTR